MYNFYLIIYMLIRCPAQKEFFYLETTTFLWYFTWILLILRIIITVSFMAIKRDKFDFDIGHLVKSPCNDCSNRDKFPQCSDTCEVLDKIRTLLAKGISSSYSS